VATESSSTTQLLELQSAIEGDRFSDDDLLNAANAAFEDDTYGIKDHGSAEGSMPPPPRSHASAGQAPPPPSGAPMGAPAGHGRPPARRLYRSRTNRKVGGVSGGIAEYFQLDPTLVRLLTLLVVFTGAGGLVYLAAWVIVPARPKGMQPQTGPTTPMDRATLIGLGIGVLALTVGVSTGSWSLFALALIAGGIWLLSEQTATEPAAATSYEPADIGGEPAYSAAPADYAYPPYQPAAPAVRKPQRITWSVLGVLTLLAGLAITSTNVGWWDPNPVVYVGFGLMTIAVGVIAGQIMGGGARGLIPLGLVTALLLVPLSIFAGYAEAGIGERVYRPTSITDLRSNYELGIGALTVDLSQIDFADQDKTVEIDLGIGELIVIVNDETGGQAVLQAKAGEIVRQLPSTGSELTQDGVNIESGTVQLRGDSGSLNLDIDVGLGVAELQTAGG
jgi:phage shock protein PspC (stress-responsive transcriptional regulator)